MDLNVLYSAIFVFLMSFALASCDSKTGEVVAVDDIIRPAKLTVIKNSEGSFLSSYPAEIGSLDAPILSFEVSGQVKTVHVVESQKVNMGDVLVELDKRDLQAKLDSSRADFKQLNTSYQRAVRLIRDDAISKSELDQRKSKRDVSEASLKTALKALQNTTLIAMTNGHVSRVFVKEQQVVTPGESVLTVLGDGMLVAKVNMPSNVVASADRSKGKAQGIYITLDAAPNQRFPAQFKEASLEADPESQTYEITFSFERPKDLIILPGMSATVWINKAAANKGTIIVPLAAIASDGKQNYVWVVDERTHLVSKRYITIKQGIGENIEVVSGLSMGEVLVSAGLSTISEGMKVRPWSK